ncbi:MAG: hypothetical protein ABMA13_01290 [Chthoniobacteraceae bacterium]
MRTRSIFLLLAAASTARAEIAIVNPESPVVVFAGRPAEIEWRIENRGDAPAKLDCSHRVFQLSSATAAPIGPAAPWKTLALEPGQRMIETLAFALPAVRATTTFRVEILSEGKPLGRQLVLACPTDLLKGAKLSVHDPDARLASALARLGALVSRYNPDEAPPADAVIVIAASRAQIPSPLGTGRGAIVLLPARDIAAATLGGRLGVLVEHGKIFCTDAARFAEIETDAGAQLDFFKLVQLALGRETLPFTDANVR